MKSLVIVLLLQLLLPPAASASPGATPWLQSLLDAASPGTVVRIPAGTHLVSAPLRVPPGVSVRGAGTAATTLLLDRRAWARFGNAFLVQPAVDGGVLASDVVLSDLTVDGNRSNRAKDSTPDGQGERGGGVKTGDRWTVERVRFTNLNYFRVWVYRSRSVVIRDNTFDAEGGSASGHDNVGGGRSSDVRVERNHFAASAAGNAVDLLRSTRVLVSGNRSQRGIYLEGVVDSTVEGNTVDGAGITVGSDAAYEPNGPAVNPRGVVVRGNSVSRSPAQAIAITYGANSAGAVRGGGNLVTGNTTSASALAGIAVVGCDNALVDAPDTVAGNTVVDPFTRITGKWGTGCGTLLPCGIGATVGKGLVVRDNTVRDTRATPRVRWGVDLAPSGAKAGVVAPVVSGNAADRATDGPVRMPGQ